MGDPILDALNRKIGNVQTAPVAAPDMHTITSAAESGGRDFTTDGRVVTSRAGAKGSMQVMDGTNASPGFGVAPARDSSLGERSRVGHDYLDAMMNRYGGDPAKAWAAYNAGPGRVDNAVTRGGANWLGLMPAETQTYVQSNVAQLGGDPQPAATVDPNDPVLTALNGVIDGAHGNGSLPPNGPQEGGDPDRTAAGGPSAVGGSQGAGGWDPDRNAGGPQDARNPDGQRYIGPHLPGLQTAAEGINDLATGVGEGWNSFQNSLVGLGTRASDAVGLTTGAHEAYNRALGIVKQDDPASYANPDGWARSIGHFIGEAVPTAPVSEIKVGAALGPTSRLAQALAKYGDYALQGAAGGVLNSGGDNIAVRAGEGAALTPLIGAAAEHLVAPIASKVWSAAQGAAHASPKPLTRSRPLARTPLRQSVAMPPGLAMRSLPVRAAWLMTPHPLPRTSPLPRPVVSRSAMRTGPR